MRSKKLQEQIVHLRKQGLEFKQIAVTLGVSREDIWKALDAWHNGLSLEPYKFPPALLEDWDKTRLAILRKYGGAKYRDEKR